MYKVIIGNIGNVCESSERNDAADVFLLYRRRSILNMGRGAQEDVTMFDEDNIRAEHFGCCPTTADVKDALEWAGHTGWDADNKVRADALRKGCWTLTWRAAENWCEYTLSSGPITRSGAYLSMLIAETELLIAETELRLGQMLKDLR